MHSSVNTWHFESVETLKWVFSRLQEEGRQPLRGGRINVDSETDAERLTIALRSRCLSAKTVAIMLISWVNDIIGVKPLEDGLGNPFKQIFSLRVEQYRTCAKNITRPERRGAAAVVILQKSLQNESRPPSSRTRRSSC